MIRIITLILALTLGLAATGCTRLDKARPMDGRGLGEFPKERLASRSSIPADFGDLVGVTSSADHPYWAQAWFMRADKSLVVVWINARTGYMLENALVIPRK
jgi:hypothetical protein